MATREAGGLGDLLKQFRTAARLTQEELAERAGISTRTVSDLERGLNRSSRPDTIRRLADALELTPAQRSLLLPPLQSILVSHPTNLPDEPTPFIGRKGEIKQMAGLLQDPSIRMVTLTGPGGTGKTRLAIEVGTTLLHDFRDGVYVVNLAPLIDPALVPAAVAEALEVQEEAGKDLMETLTDHLKDQHLLLVLDNYEHLLDAAAVVASLLDRCRALQVLVTSRIPLHLSREHEHAVPPLSVPDPTHLPNLETLLQYEAVALFTERAAAVKDSFTLTIENAPAVAEICYCLDGLPLAIELAAARIKLFPPQALLQRLSSRLKLLTRGPRDWPIRQQTLRNTIDWSYSLLSEPEQTLFAQLSVFAGGCTFAAAEEVCSEQGDLDLVDGLASLVEQSLVRQEGETEPRFRMLETIREYAAEKLAERAEADDVRQAHARFFLRLAEEAEPQLRGPDQRRWVDRLEAEHDNLRAARGWLLGHGHVDEELHMATGLHRFWDHHGHLSEGVRWLQAGLEQARGVNEGTRARALSALGSRLAAQGELDRATALEEEALTLFATLEDRNGTAEVLLHLASIAWHRGDQGRAIQRAEEALAIERSAGSPGALSLTLNNLGAAALQQGLLDEAEARFDEARTLAQHLGLTRNLAWALGSLGHVALLRQRYDQAADYLLDSLRLGSELRAYRLILDVLDGMARVAVETGDPERAARLAGSEAAIRADLGAPVAPTAREDNARTLERIRQALPDDVYRRAWEAGRAATLKEAVAYALRESG